MAFSLFRGGCGLQFFEQSTGVQAVGFVEIKFGRAQLRPNTPLRVAKQFGKILQCFIGSAQGSQHLRRAELGIRSKGRTAVRCHLSVEG